MASKPQNDDSKRNRLPFEPANTRKKAEKTPPPPSPPKQSQGSGKMSKPAATRSGGSIPEAVSRRMVKRMALFCGIPTLLGFSSFFVSYYIVVNEVFKLPNTAVLLVSLGFFGLGVLGLSYGALSASWDENSPGGLLGWDEFTANLGRMRQAWREARNQSKSS